MGMVQVEASTLLAMAVYVHPDRPMDATPLNG
jgi:hypothetical protein